MDLNGKVVFERILEKGIRISERIEVPGRVPGVYVIKVISGSAVEYRKVVVE
jgi:hypothetical protein